MSRDESFPRAHRLKRRRLIRSLFDRSRGDVDTLATGCVRVVFRRASPAEVGAEVPLQIGFTPGRTETAVQRNRIRRVLREVYRRHQHALTDLLGDRADVLIVMVIFRGNAAQADVCIPRDLPGVLEQLTRHLEGQECGSK